MDENFCFYVKLLHYQTYNLISVTLQILSE
nr:MAG TPA: hypothetical protein [Caudoviricetes sp.]